MVRWRARLDGHTLKPACAAWSLCAVAEFRAARPWTCTVARGVNWAELCGGRYRGRGGRICGRRLRSKGVGRFGAEMKSPHWARAERPCEGPRLCHHCPGGVHSASVWSVVCLSIFCVSRNAAGYSPHGGVHLIRPQLFIRLKPPQLSGK
ncbi:hypothetical protein EJ04DRAFT_353463 [Polyplosphaeria fusca]|uniref:Uncharacterized protein n=1 Tax=Polyplosphaeria fusca TaxID=682080 RepID=A0A9P4R9D2_9PLEO|nr:hypothetical protein EJ04DRAFT_353463 [Polyplosphaeria fusca]